MAVSLAAAEFVGDLGDGLVLRWSTAADQEKIGRCLGMAFRDGADKPPNQRMINRAAVMFSPGFPSMGPGDYAVVEDTRAPGEPVVACACLWQQTWSFAGIPFSVGRPEYVATLGEYRNRGLVRRLFEMLHARSAARGDHMQVILGIGYYYRQFGYEYALDLWGYHAVLIDKVPARKEDAPEPYSLRPATAADTPHLLALYNVRRDASLVWNEVNEEGWRYYITAWDEPAVRDQAPGVAGLGRRLHMVVDAEGQVCGFAGVGSSRRDHQFHVYFLELYPTINWQRALPSILRGLHGIAQAAPTAAPDTAPLRELTLMLGRQHPAYAVLGKTLAPKREEPYAWYVRVADVPGFVQMIAPVLEERLARSILCGHSGELVVDFYRGGLRLRFDAGRLAEVAPWRAPGYDDNATAGCPALLFLQLLLGYRSLADLRASYPDVWADEDAALLLDILLPKQNSTAAPIGYP